MLTQATQVVHALYTTEAERAALHESGASVSLSPWSEMLIGYGVPPVWQLATSGILLGLSADTLSLTGTADPWSSVRLATSLYRGQAEQELVAPTRRMLELVTTDAATCLGLDHLVGSLTPGTGAGAGAVEIATVLFGSLKVRKPILIVPSIPDRSGVSKLSTTIGSAARAASPAPASGGPGRSCGSSRGGAAAGHATLRSGARGCVATAPSASAGRPCRASTSR